MQNNTENTATQAVQTDEQQQVVHLETNETPTEQTECEKLAETGTEQEKRDFLQTSDDVETDAKTLGLEPSDFDGEELSRHSTPEFSEWLSESDWVSTADGTIKHCDDLIFCDEDQEWHETDDCVEVQTNLRGGTEWRLSDSPFHFFCHENQTSYCSRNFSEVEIEGDSYCVEMCDEIYFWESDGEYHLESEPEEEEEEIEPRLGLSGYQNGARSDVLPGRAVSLEIELVVGKPSPSFGDEIRAICDACEQDGSLPTNGAEIIVGSTLVSDLPDKLTDVCSVFNRFDCSGHVEGKEGIGIHVSVSRKGWEITNAVLARMLILVGENKSFFEAVAQRKETHWANYGNGHPKAACRKAKNGRPEKYEAVAIRTNDRIEFRLFRSSCRKDRILKNVETVIAVVDFSKKTMNHRDVKLAAFRDFLKENRKSFPNLTTFISEKGI